MSRIGVVGSGAMGQGIVQVLAQSGHEVCWLDSRIGAAKEAKSSLQKIWQRMAQKEKCTPTDISTWLTRVYLASELEKFVECDVVIEAIVEVEAEKYNLFKRLERIINSEAVLATNTSSIPITRLASGLKHPQRFAGFHCFNPVPLMPLVEIISGLQTHPQTIQRLKTLSQVMGLTPICVRDTPGFLVNQVGRALPIESAHILAERIASHEEIDIILREQAGFKMGPFELMDLTGLDVTQPVTETLFREHFGEPRYRPSILMGLRRDAGLLGRKTTKGFYGYAENARTPRASYPNELSGSEEFKLRPKSIWISAADETGRKWLEELIGKSGIPIERGSKPSDNALVVLAPLGEDTTAMVTRLGLPAKRSVAVDTLFTKSHRRVVMPCLMAEQATIGQALDCLSIDEIPISLIRESTGFVSQRVIALMINLSCELAHQGVAQPRDIDSATRLALGYPRGPLEWGDLLGADRVLRILQSIFMLSGDPRYRPSAWLRRRVQLGQSLLTEEPERRQWQN